MPAAGDVDTLVRARQVEDRMDTLARERARNPPRRRHYRRRCREPLPLLGERAVGLVQRPHQDVGPPAERVDIDARRERRLAMRPHRGEAVALRPGSGRSTDARPLHTGVGRREPGQEAHLLLPLAELVDGVGEAHQPLAHPLDLFGEQAVLVLESTAARDVDPARNGRGAQHQERQRDHAADPGQDFHDGLRQLDGAGSSRAVRHHHDRPASLRLVAHLPVATSRQRV